MNNNQLQIAILDWALNKGLMTDITQDRINAQAHKVLEEIGETCGAFLKGNRDELLDGIGDIGVTLILINVMDEYDPFDFNLGTIIDVDNTLLHVATAFMKGNYADSIEYLHRFALSQDTTLEYCLELAYNVIAKRKGRMVGNTFIKES